MMKGKMKVITNHKKLNKKGYYGRTPKTPRSKKASTVPAPGAEWKRNLGTKPVGNVVSAILSNGRRVYGFEANNKNWEFGTNQPNDIIWYLLDAGGDL